MGCVELFRLGIAGCVVAMLFLQVQLVLTYGVSVLEEFWFGEDS